jgi:hypothetical protein
MALRALAGLALLISLPTAAAQPLRDELSRPAYRSFFDDLQQAVRTNDRARVLRLISYPLRVTSSNAAGTYRRSRFYRTQSAVRAHYDRIFTPQVRRVILRQRYEQLFVNSHGAMFGNGEIWFAEICADRSCATTSASRIITVNP